ncbi:hypothetical protein HHI36_000363 [Cryptolaemus montrouzieri]|uniref:Uncharacterized protein n=1 Tax=Cryptolaemus montrouzieri TaxID=559131 RepID=A0ABD2P4Q4_9CUCU
MFVLKLVVLLSITTSFVICEDVFSLLPKKFELDDPEECNNGIFCKISVALTPYNSSTRPESWSKIEDMKRDYHYFRHDKLLHGRCFRKKHSKSLEDIVKDEYATKYRNESLKGNVETYVCMEKGRLLLDDIDYWDLFFISIGIIYVVFMVIATAYTYSAEHQKDNFFIKFLSIFSIIKIWGELRKPIKMRIFKI